MVKIICYKFFFYVQYEAALAVDSVRLMVEALGPLLSRKPTILATTMRHNTFTNNGTDGIQCESDPIVPWVYGPQIHEAIRNVIEIYFAYILQKCIVLTIIVSSSLKLSFFMTGFVRWSNRSCYV